MTRRYGGNDTIHQTGHVDVEQDSEGNVVAVWFRCLPLPFKAVTSNDGRCQGMRFMYQHESIRNLIAVEVDNA